MNAHLAKNKTEVADLLIQHDDVAELSESHLPQELISAFDGYRLRKL